MKVRINVFYSPDPHCYWANSPDLDGLTVSGRTREEVEREAHFAAVELLELGCTSEIKSLELDFQDA